MNWVGSLYWLWPQAPLSVQKWANMEIFFSEEITNGFAQAKYTAIEEKCSCVSCNGWNVK